MTNENPTLLELNDVGKQYGGIAGRPGLVVLERISLTVAAGESVAIIGPSGSGKSTLLNMIGTLDQPTSGRILLEGRDLTGLNEEDLARLRNRRIGFIFQAHHLLPQCSVLENVLIPTLADNDGGRIESWRERAKANSEPGITDDVTRARNLLSRVGLSGRVDHRPGQLSGGECQRVAIVRALINRPSLLLADEPTGLLDRENAESLMQLLISLNQEEGVTLIMVTHAERLAARMGRVFELRDQRLVDFDSRKAD